METFREIAIAVTAIGAGYDFFQLLNATTVASMLQYGMAGIMLLLFAVLIRLIVFQKKSGD